MDDYKNFVARMGSFDMELTPPDDDLQHYGVKGMKWGVRKKRSSANVTKAKKEPSRLVKNVKSIKREMAMTKSLKNLDSMTDVELRDTTTRYRLENDLKRLTEPKNKLIVSKKKQKKYDEYLNREKLSDVDLKTRVERLQLEDNLKKQVKNANRDKVKLANKAIREVSKATLKSFTDANGKFSATGDAQADLILKYVLTATSKGKTLDEN